MLNKISIIIPVYNVENFIEETLFTVVNQTYQNLEIIVVNDGSTDKSMEIVEKFAQQDKRFVIINKENGGVSDARNKGLEVATGDYIGFVDPDDLPDKTMFEKMLDSILENNAQISICEYVFFYPDGKKRVAGATKKMMCYPYYESKIALENVYTGPYRSVWNKLYKAELFDGVEFPKGLIFEGTAIQYKLFLKATKVAIINEPLYFYRAVREGSLLSVKTAKQNKDWFEVYYNVYNSLLGVNEVVSTYCYKAMIKRYANLDSEQKEEFSHIRQFLLDNMKKYYSTKSRLHMQMYIRFNFNYKTSILAKFRKFSKKILRKSKKICRKGFYQIRITFYKVLGKVIKKDDSQIIFFSNPDYADNSKALYEEMIRKNLHEKFKFIWVVEDYNKYKDKIPYATVVKKGSSKSFSYFIKSKYIFRTHKKFAYARLDNKNQIRVLLWHGNSLKVIPETANKRHLKPNYSVISADIFKCKWEGKLAYEGQSLVSGLPRNDELFTKVNLSEKFKFKKEFNKIIMWMPTFRKSSFEINDGVNNEYGIPLMTDENMLSLNTKLKELNILLLIKIHPFAIVEKNVVKLSNIWPIHDQIFDTDFTLYNLLGNTDALLTDYSSVYIDYLIKDKPIGFVYDDFNEYKDSRGFIVSNPKKYMPGAHIDSFNELIDFIDNISKNIDEYKQQRMEISSTLNKYTDDKNSCRLLELLKIN